ncbi:MAG: tol-pal system-associated acyl-CoA thioesterase [Mariprofundaceae bacterium]|nr:tol-pal system-associated acyl-CoA thioesterase [Mariprofundaceae bacterium]
MSISRLEVRIYYEDTDHGGVVYHANYLKFMERGRTEFLRNLGFEQSILAAQEDVLFALTRSDVRYVLPALFDDLLTVETCLMQAKGARIHFVQRILRPNSSSSPTLLVEADIHLACMQKSGKAKRIPPFILEKMRVEEFT